MTISLPKLRRRAAVATPQNAAEAIKYHLGQIAELFDRPKLTLVVRSPTVEGDLICGNDDIGIAIAALQAVTLEFGGQAVVPLAN